jgi:hypothetical protein
MRDARNGNTASEAPLAPPTIDLTRYSEATRRALYDAVVAIHFSATKEEVREAAEAEEWIEVHTVEEAGVVIHYLVGRWIVVWRMLDEPEEAPEKLRWEAVSVHEDPAKPFGLGFSEV